MRASTGRPYRELGTNLGTFPAGGGPAHEEKPATCGPDSQGGAAGEGLSRPLSRRELLAARRPEPGLRRSGRSSPHAAATTQGRRLVEATAGRGGELKMWWWGEQEAVGIQQWVDDHPREVQDGQRHVGHADADGHRQRRAAVHERGRGGQAARRPVPVQRHLPHGERVAGLHRAAHGLVSTRPCSTSSGATKMSSTRASSTASASTRSPFGIAYNKAHFEGRARPRRTAEDVGRVHRGVHEAQVGRARSRSAAASRTASSASGTSSTR